MLISPPFLLPRLANETDEAFVARCMPDSSVTVPGTQAPEGSFPVSFKLGWHGGLHLQAPTGADNQAVTSVRAIADGEVVYARRPTPRNETPSPGEPRNYNPYGDRPTWTDDGCVIIRHRTEIGADRRTNAATQVTFLSIYMHLSELRGVARQVAAGNAQSRNVYRKDQIGVAGHVYGNNHQLHLEIVCDADNLQHLMQRRTGELNTAQDGRDDAVFGELYFRLPPGTPFYAQRPAHHVTAPTAAAAHALQGDALYVGLRYAGGERQQARHERGDAYLTSYRADGTALGEALREADAEYSLYTTAIDISNAYPANGRPAPSAVYELLRFGRVIGPDALNPADVPHWRQVRYPGGQGWVNLNAPDVRKFSDADFPQWRGWKLIDDDADADSRCESAQLTALIEDPSASDGRLTREELVRRLSLQEVREKLKRTICLVPSEWDQASAPARWGWLNGDPEFGLEVDDFNELMGHINALTFNWANANTGIGTTHWHWQPREFILHFRKLNWLSRDALRRVYPTSPEGVLDRYRSALNQVLRRYGMNKRLRAAHFLGQGLVETMGLQLMVEGSVSFARNPGHASFQPESAGYYADPLDLYGYFHNYERVGNDLGNATRSHLRDRQGRELPVVLGRDARNRPIVTSPTVGQIDAARSQVGDGMKFRGRGFKQLTGLNNYAQYWVFRGWLHAQVDFDDSWWEPPRRPGAQPRRPPQIADPQRISTEPFNCIDSGGQFAARNGILRQADGGISRADSDNVSRIVNRWDQPSFERRFDGATTAYEILGP